MSKDLAARGRAVHGRRRHGFLGAHGLTNSDIGAWVSHPGGPKVIDAINRSLDLPAEALELTWRSLGEIGNLSSASVLHVLRDTIAKKPPSGSPGTDARDGSRILLPSWCYCAGTRPVISTLDPGCGDSAARLAARIRWAGSASVVLATNRASITVISVVAMTAPMQRCNPPLNGMNSCGAGLRYRATRDPSAGPESLGSAILGLAVGDIRAEDQQRPARMRCPSNERSRITRRAEITPGEYKPKGLVYNAVEIGQPSEVGGGRRPVAERRRLTSSAASSHASGRVSSV